MKKIGFKSLFLAIALFSASHATAQSEYHPTPQNVVKLNVGSLFLLHGNVAYQRALGKHFSLQVAGLYGNLNLPVDVKQYIGFNVPYIKSINYEGFGVVPEFRYYPLNVTTAPQGWYINAFYQYREANIKNCVDESIVSNPKQYTVNFKFVYTGVGLGTGYQFMFGRDRNIVIDASVGLKYSTVSLRTRWDGIVKFDPISNPSGGYYVSPDDAKTVENFLNREVVDKVNNQELGLGFLSAVDIFRSTLYVGYGF